MSPKHLQLFTLGRLALVSSTGEDAGLNKRQRKLAFLAVVALSTRPPTRGKLAAMFWGDEDEERARHSVSDALSHLRRVLGRDAIAARATAVSLSSNVRLAVDAIEFTTACESRNYAHAIDLYQGQFLADINTGFSSDFEQWVERERDKYDRLFIRACEAHVPGLARSDSWTRCAEVASRWLDADPRSTDAPLYLLKSIAADGSRDSLIAALDRYEAHTMLLAHEFHAKPPSTVTEFAAQLSARLKDTDHAVLFSPAPALPVPESRTEAQPDVAPTTQRDTANASSVAPSVAPLNPVLRSGRRHLPLAFATLVACIAIAVAATTLNRGTLASLRPASRTNARPVIAITHFENVRGDTAIAWLSDGFKQMVASDLSRSNAVEIIAPERVREAVERSGVSRAAIASIAASLSIAKRLGATWAVSGGITRGGDAYVMNVTLRSVQTGQRIRMFTVTGNDVLALADQAAARILGAANAESPGPRLADLETASVSAYQHYVRAVQARDEGRYTDEVRELDLAVLADSGFVSALTARLRLAEDARDRPVIARLAGAFERASRRATDWDRLRYAAWMALHNGEHSRAESLGAELVHKFPHDPRAYAMQSEILTSHGKWVEAATVLEQALSLDSLAVAAGQGPCAPCTAYDGLVILRGMAGDFAAAEHDARRWIAVEPDAPAAWLSLATTLVSSGKFDPAIHAMQRATMLSGDDPHYSVRAARILLMARRDDDVDSVIATWRTRPEAVYQINVGDIESMLQRERGEYRASSRTIEQLTAKYPESSALGLVRANNLARIGLTDSAARVYETFGHASGDFDPRSPYYPLRGDDARGFAWHHALEADVLASAGDTARSRILADSIELVSARSYYGRDTRLPHDIRGVIALRAHRFNDAVQELQKGRWGTSGWTTTLAHLARAYLALNRPADAIATVREAYQEPPDAMGRYEPRSELDLLMAESFLRAGELDSATVYADYVRSAWRNADPEPRARLAEFEKLVSVTDADGRRPTALSHEPVSLPHATP